MPIISQKSLAVIITFYIKIILVAKIQTNTQDSKHYQIILQSTMNKQVTSIKRYHYDTKTRSLIPLFLRDSLFERPYLTINRHSLISHTPLTISFILSSPHSVSHPPHAPRTGPPCIQISRYWAPRPLSYATPLSEYSRHIGPLQHIAPRPR